MSYYENADPGRGWHILLNYIFIPFSFSLILVTSLGAVLHLTIPGLPSSGLFYLFVFSVLFSAFLGFLKLDNHSLGYYLVLRIAHALFLSSLIIITALKLNPLSPNLAVESFKTFAPILLLFSTGVLAVAYREKSRRHYTDFSSGTEDHESVKTIPSWGITSRLALFLIIALFLTIKISMPYIFPGSYIDEFFHIGSAMELIEHGHLATFYNGVEYTRGLLVSGLVAIAYAIFGHNLLAAKLVPAFIGALNFGLLYKILIRLRTPPFYTNVVLLIYTLSPWVIFNHFYIRSNVTTEFFVLLSCLLFLHTLSLRRIRMHNAAFLGLPVVIVALTDPGSSLNLLIFLYALFASYFISTKIFRVESYFYIASAILLSIATLYVSRTADIKYASITDFNYWNIFFNDTFPLTICFLLASVVVRRDVRFLAVSTAVLFSFLTLLPSSQQLLRGILFFFPLYYVGAVQFISHINLHWIHKYAISLFFLTILLLNYPPSFFQTPYLPNETNYIDTRIFDDVKTMCPDSVIISSSRPRIFKFFNVPLDYHINSIVADTNWQVTDPEASMYFHDESTGLYHDTDTKTPVITSVDQLRNIVSASANVCIVTGGLPAFWVSNDISEYISSAFVEASSTYISNFDYRRVRLYIKQRQERVN